MHSLCELAGDGVLVLAIARRQDLRGIGLAKEEVDDVEEALKVSILEIIPDGDESYGNSGRDTDSILNIEVLVIPAIGSETIAPPSEQRLTHRFDASLVTLLRILPTVKGL